MPVVVLIGSASSFAEDLSTHFARQYEVKIHTGPFVSVRSMLSNQSEQVLYVVPGLDKPERYEIFCLARKNGQQFISIARSMEDGAVASDKNLVIIEKFDGERVQQELAKAWLAKTSANKRSKGISMRGLGDLKIMIDKINEEFRARNGPIDCILAKCESQIVKMWGSGLGSTAEELEACYRKMVGTELKNKGISKQGE